MAKYSIDRLISVIFILSQIFAFFCLPFKKVESPVLHVFT